MTHDTFGTLVVLVLWAAALFHAVTGQWVAALFLYFIAPLMWGAAWGD